MKASTLRFFVGTLCGLKISKRDNLITAYGIFHSLHILRLIHVEKVALIGIYSRKNLITLKNNSMLKVIIRCEINEHSVRYRNNELPTMFFITLLVLLCTFLYLSSGRTMRYHRQWRLDNFLYFTVLVNSFDIIR